jgi:LEA14-like dessication related protein
VTGCSLLARATGSFDDPTITLQSSKVEALSPRTTNVLLVLVVHNPNGFALHPQALRYRLRVNQVVIADGSSDAAATIPPGCSVAIEIPIEVSRERLSNAAPDAVMLGEVAYDLDVRLIIYSWLQKREINFAASSVLRMSLPLGLAHAAAVALGAEGWQS